MKFLFMFYLFSFIYSECNNGICEISDYEINPSCPEDCNLLNTYIDNITVDSYPFSVPINISGTTEYLGVEYIIEFDSSVISFEDIELNGTIFEESDFNVTHNLIEPNLLAVAYFTIETLLNIEGGTIANIIFSFNDNVDPGETSIINIIEMKINNFYIQCNEEDEDCLVNQNAIIEI